jgi:hypothetical protein
MQKLRILANLALQLARDAAKILKSSLNSIQNLHSREDFRKSRELKNRKTLF